MTAPDSVERVVADLRKKAAEDRAESQDKHAPSFLRESRLASAQQYEARANEIERRNKEDPHEGT